MTTTPTPPQTNRPNVNPTPKERFRSSAAAVSAHRDLMQRQDLQMSLDFALLEYGRRRFKPMNDQFAGAEGLRVAGAYEFVECLKNLAEPMPELTVMPSKQNLDHRA